MEEIMGKEVLLILACNSKVNRFPEVVSPRGTF
jgi:hypothetical protein